MGCSGSTVYDSQKNSDFIEKLINNPDSELAKKFFELTQRNGIVTIIFINW